jgi:hypothetical protein
MSSFQKIFAWVCTVSLSTAFQSMSLALAGPQGGDPSCTETHAVKQSCATLSWVKIERGKPLIAERVSESKSASHSMKRIELVARDTFALRNFLSQIAPNGGRKSSSMTSPGAFTNLIPAILLRAARARPF